MVRATELKRERDDAFLATDAVQLSVCGFNQGEGGTALLVSTPASMLADTTPFLLENTGTHQIHTACSTSPWRDAVLSSCGYVG